MGELEGAAARLEWNQMPRKPCCARIPASEARTFAPNSGAKATAFLQAVGKVPGLFRPPEGAPCEREPPGNQFYGCRFVIKMLPSPLQRAAPERTGGGGRRRCRARIGSAAAAVPPLRSRRAALVGARPEVGNGRAAWPYARFTPSLSYLLLVV